MKILASEVPYEELRPGELYSNQPPEFWAGHNPETEVAFGVWLRGGGQVEPLMPGEVTTRLEVEVPAVVPVLPDYSGTLYCPVCARALRPESREGCDPVEAEMTCGDHHWFFLVGDGWVEGFQCNEGDRR